MVAIRCLGPKLYVYVLELNDCPTMRVTGLVRSTFTFVEPHCTIVAGYFVAEDQEPTRANHPSKVVLLHFSLSATLGRTRL